MKTGYFADAQVWLSDDTRWVGIGVGYERADLSKKDVVKLIAFLVKALVRMK